MTKRFGFCFVFKFQLNFLSSLTKFRCSFWELNLEDNTYRGQNVFRSLSYLGKFPIESAFNFHSFGNRRTLQDYPTGTRTLLKVKNKLTILLLTFCLTYVFLKNKVFFTVKHEIIELKFSNFSKEILENIFQKIVRPVKFLKINFCLYHWTQITSWLWKYHWTLACW